MRKDDGNATIPRGASRLARAAGLVALLFTTSDRADAQVQRSVVAFEGGSGGSGLNYSSLDSASVQIDNTGRVGFVSTLNGNFSRSGAFTWTKSGGTVLLGQGQSDFTDNATGQPRYLTLSDNGEAYYSRVSNFGGKAGVYVTDSDGSAQVLGPQTTNGFGLYNLRSNANGQVAFLLRSAVNDQSVYVGDRNGVSAAATTGGAAPGVPGATFAPSPVGFQNTFTGLSFNAGGQVAFFGDLAGSGIDSTNDQAIWVGTPGNLTMVAREGTQAPGADPGVVFQTADRNYVGLNSGGQVAFFNRLSGPGVDSSNDHGVWAGTPDSLQLVARRGDPAGGSFGSNPIGGITNNSVRINDTGQVAFRAGVASGGSVNLANDTGIFFGLPGYLQVVAREGGQAPGTPSGTEFDQLPFQAALNNNGQIAFLAPLKNDPGLGGDVTSSNNQGLFALDPLGQSYLVDRKGNVVTVGAGSKTISSLSLQPYSGGGDGWARSFNDHGQLAYYATFSDNSHAILYAELPKDSVVTQSTTIGGNQSRTVEGTVQVTSGTELKVIDGAHIQAQQAVTVDHGGNLTLQGSTFQAPSVTSNGTVANDGTLDGSLTLGDGGTLTGSGTVTGSVAVAGGSIQVGHSPGSATTGSETWSAGDFVMEINDATGSAGSSWDLLNVNGTLDITDPFTVRLNSLLKPATPGDDANTPGNVANFDSTSSYEWTFLTATGPITGFSNLSLDASGFLNGLGGGTLTLFQQGNSLGVRFTAVPEPASLALVGLGLAAVFGLARRRRAVADR